MVLNSKINGLGTITMIMSIFDYEFALISLILMENIQVNYFKYP
jgi:hypothetical protein